MTLFQPTGEKAQWRLVYEFVRDKEPGTLITYAEFAAVLGYDPSRQGGGRHAIYRADRELLEKDNRTLTRVRGEGYRVAHASEHEKLAKKQQKGAQRKIRRAVAVAVHVDRNNLTEAQRRSLDNLADLLMSQNNALAQHDQRLTEVEATAARDADRIAVIEETLRSRGIHVPTVQTVQGETV